MEGSAGIANVRIPEGVDPFCISVEAAGWMDIRSFGEPLVDSRWRELQSRCEQHVSSAVSFVCDASENDLHDQLRIELQLDGIPVDVAYQCLGFPTSHDARAASPVSVGRALLRGCSDQWT